MNYQFNIILNQSKPLLLDGAMGSYLQMKGFETDDIIWTTNINKSNPDIIIEIHKEYIQAGADIITTNTFRTNPSALQYKGISDVSYYVTQAVKLAKQSINGEKFYIAGSNAPAEDCYQVERKLSNYELQMNHYKHIDLLIDSGVDFILNETQSHSDEIKIICEHCDRNNIPYIVSLFFTKDQKILSGESINYVLTFLNDHNPLAIGFNCISYGTFLKTIGSINLPVRWGFYLNCGSGMPTDQEISCSVTPEEYYTYVKNFLTYKPVFVGSCCGSRPEHTKRLRKLLDKQYDS
jgi:homocysteine S-methyltransferase